MSSRVFCFLIALLVLWTPELSNAEPLIMTFSGGALFAKPGDTQTLPVMGGFSKTYKDDSKTDQALQAEFFIGIARPLGTKFSGEFGLEMAQTTGVQSTGHIWDFADQTFDNYTYSYKIAQTRLALKNKFFYDAQLSILPYMSVGIGIGANRAYGYQSTPITNGAADVPNHDSKTVMAFTYTIGIGFEKSFREKWRWGFGFEHIDLGRTQLGSASGAGLGPSTNHVYTNSFMLNITYLTGEAS